MTTGPNPTTRSAVDGENPPGGAGRQARLARERHPSLEVIDTRSAQGRLDGSLGVGFVVQAISTGETWQVREEPDFFPALVSTWEAALLEEDRIDPAGSRASSITSVSRASPASPTRTSRVR